MISGSWTNLLHARAAACTVVLLALFAAPLRADEIKLSGIWLPNVQILAMRDGKLTYSSAAGAELTKPLAEIEGVRFADVPQYRTALEALEAGDTKAALPLLDKAAAAAHTPWAKAYISAAKWRGLAQSGNARAAVREYLALAATGADPHFLAEPPIESIAAAEPAQRTDVASMLRAALPRVAEPIKPHLQAMLDVAAVAPPAAAAPAEEAPAKKPMPDEGAPPVAESAVVLPVKMTESEATKLLHAGKFDEAVTQIDADLKQEGGLAVDLYLRGIALVYKAEETGDLDTYKDAGLAFMRVLVYFPRSDFAGRNLVGGSLLELAYIHDKLGRTEKATELYARAAAELDEASDPNLYQRLTQLRDSR